MKTLSPLDAARIASASLDAVVLWVQPGEANDDLADRVHDRSYKVGSVLGALVRDLGREDAVRFLEGDSFIQVAETPFDETRLRSAARAIDELEDVLNSEEPNDWYILDRGNVSAYAIAKASERRYA